MIRDFTYYISKTDEGMTIQDFLKQKGFSHSVIVHLKKTPESILRNFVWSYVNEKLCADDRLDIHLIENEGSPKILPVTMPLDIAYEDDDLLILNKPADTPIHPSLHNYENTLANGVMHYFAKQNMPYTFRCINRLDRDTTGLTILAKNMLAAGKLSLDMQKHLIQKEYYAICTGELPESGTIDAPIARARDSAIERCVDDQKGETAITHFTREWTNGSLSLARISLETGRTHQIRVHMLHIGHPLIGDFLYNPADTQMNRQALHCHQLTFTHPVTGESMRIQATLPEDMRALLTHHGCTINEPITNLNIV